MIGEIAEFALILAMSLVAIHAASVYAAYGLSWQRFEPLARNGIWPVAFFQWLLIASAFLMLVFLFVTNDFSNAYVAGHSNSFLPWYYRISAVWGGHEGSLLLWAFILSSWYVALATRGTKQMPADVLALACATLGFILVGFLLFILGTSNPFLILPMPSPADGQDLNPLLQDIGLIIHPPLLYMGYVGLSVAFAFAVAGLIHGNVGPEWARWTKPWTLVAWAFLTLGIALGSWWAYYELGWGGWWFWDPVENASLMPWLAATGLIHSLVVTDKRGILKAWTLFLALLGFSLSLLGTFLVRSGVLNSVHAFANDPERGLFILMLLGVVIGGSLLLYAARAHLVESKQVYALLSRVSSLLLNNILLVTATFVVLLGTLYPLIEDLMGKSKSSVGAPYFNALFVPLTWGLLLLLCFGPRARWKKDTFGRLMPPIIRGLGFSFVITAITFYFLEAHWQAVVSVVLVALAFWMQVEDVREKVAHKSWLQGLKQLRQSYWSMQLAHLGLLVMVIGVTGVSLYSNERDVLMIVDGEPKRLGEYHVQLKSIQTIEGPNFRSTKGEVVFSPQNGAAGYESVSLWPEKRFYLAREAVMTEAAMWVGLWSDLYVALGDQVAKDRWAVRLHYKPMIRWVWGGALLMAIAGLMAARSKRKRGQDV